MTTITTTTTTTARKASLITYDVGMRSIAIFLVCVFAGDAAAGIKVKNGNLNVTEKDIEISSQAELERVYNSESTFKGMFGWHWGAAFEVYLEVSGDGSVVAHIWGCACQNNSASELRFAAPGSEQAVEAQIATMIAARKPPAGEVDSWRRQLADASYRNTEWQKLVREKLVPRATLKIGTQLVSEGGNRQVITRTATGFERKHESGKLETFDDNGLLIRISDNNQNSTELRRDVNGRLVELRDNFKREVKLSYTSRGLVSRIEGKGSLRGRVATYRYSAADDLVYSKDVDGNEYRYEYDGHHNLTAIRYPDGTATLVAYHSAAANQRVAALHDPEGGATVYSYFTDPRTADHYEIAEEVVNDQGEEVSSSRHEYFMGQRAGGERFTQRKIDTVNGIRTDTTYNECAYPLSIVRDTGQTTFRYDASCQMVFKDTSSVTLTFTYDPRLKKMTRAERLVKETAEKTWVAFKYDERGNMTEAESSEGKKVHLEYDGNGKITSGVMGGRKLHFKYNAIGKPSEITVEGTGSITVSYTPTGDIKKVDSPGGHKVSLAVTQAFQELLELTKVPGANHSF